MRITTGIGDFGIVREQLHLLWKLRRGVGKI